MVTEQQIARGIAAWIDSEFLPMLSGGSKYAAGVAGAMLAKHGEALLRGLKDHEMIRVLGIVTDDGYELDELRRVMLEQFPAEGIRIDAKQINNLIGQVMGKWGAILNIRVEGGVTFHRADVEKLYSFIMGE